MTTTKNAINDGQVYNPYLPIDVYIPDGEPHVIGDRVYVFGSHDKEGGETYCELDYVGYSAPVDDLSNWKYEGVIYSASQDPHSSEIVDGYGPRKYLYAPDVVCGNDGRYYLYYCLSAAKGKGGFYGPISVAVCDTPVGRYEYHGDVRYPDGRLMKRFIPFDPAVINDEGKIYLYYGWSYSARMSGVDEDTLKEKMKESFNKTDEDIARDGIGIMGANCVELENDMLTVKSEPKRIVPCHRMALGTEFENLAFFEASSIRKINGKYYFIYSNQVNHQLCYAISDYPDKGFRAGGVIISNGDVGYKNRLEEDRLACTGTNHGSIECINGRYYIFYHRNTHLTSYSRQGLAEEIEIQEDGSIRQVCMTSCGLNGGPLKAKGTYPSVIACNLTDGEMPHNGNSSSDKIKPNITHGDNERFITSISDNTLIGFKYFAFVGKCSLALLLRGEGQGRIYVGTDESITDSSEFDTDQCKTSLEVFSSKEWRKYVVELEEYGDKPLYLVFKGEGRFDLLNLTFE